MNPSIDFLMINDRLSIMKTATVADLRNHFKRVSRWVQEGDQVSITRRGRPVAVLSPIAPESRLPVVEWPPFEARMKKNFAGRTIKSRVSSALDEIRGSY
jgi:prevent-host-death family protein